MFIIKNLTDRYFVINNKPYIKHNLMNNQPHAMYYPNNGYFFAAPSYIPYQNPYMDINTMCQCQCYANSLPCSSPLYLPHSRNSATIHNVYGTQGSHINPPAVIATPNPPESNFHKYFAYEQSKEIERDKKKDKSKKCKCDIL